MSGDNQQFDDFLNGLPELYKKEGVLTESRKEWISIIAKHHSNTPLLKPTSKPPPTSDINDNNEEFIYNENPILAKSNKNFKTSESRQSFINDGLPQNHKPLTISIPDGEGLYSIIKTKNKISFSEEAIKTLKQKSKERPFVLSITSEEKKNPIFRAFDRLVGKKDVKRKDYLIFAKGEMIIEPSLDEKGKPIGKSYIHDLERIADYAINRDLYKKEVLGIVDSSKTASTERMSSRTSGVGGFSERKSEDSSRSSSSSSFKKAGEFEGLQQDATREQSLFGFEESYANFNDKKRKVTAKTIIEFTKQGGNVVEVEMVDLSKDEYEEKKLNSPSELEGKLIREYRYEKKSNNLSELQGKLIRKYSFDNTNIDKYSDDHNQKKLNELGIDFEDLTLSKVKTIFQFKDNVEIEVGTLHSGNLKPDSLKEFEGKIIKLSEDLESKDELTEVDQKKIDEHNNKVLSTKLNSRDQTFDIHNLDSHFDLSEAELIYEQNKGPIVVVGSYIENANYPEGEFEVNKDHKEALETLKSLTDSKSSASQKAQKEKKIDHPMVTERRGLSNKPIHPVAAASVKKELTLSKSLIDQGSRLKQTVAMVEIKKKVDDTIVGLEKSKAFVLAQSGFGIGNEVKTDLTSDSIKQTLQKKSDPAGEYNRVSRASSVRSSRSSSRSSDDWSTL